MHENNFIYTRNFLRRPCKPSYYLCEFLLKFKCQETAQLFQVFKSLWAKTWDPKLIQCIAQKPLPLKIVHYTFTKKLFMFNNSFSELFANPKNYPECMNKKKIFTETNLFTYSGSFNTKKLKFEITFL